MVTAVVEDYHDDSSDESIVSHNEEEDYFENREQNPSQGSNWKYFVRSERGGEAYDSLPKRKLPSDKFKVEINYADQINVIVRYESRGAVYFVKDQNRAAWVY